MRTSHIVLLVLAVMIGFAVFVGTVHAAAEPSASLPEDVLRALTEGKRFSVMSLDPEGVAAVPISGWEILSQNDVKDAVLRKEVIGAVKKAISEAGDSAACFMPRHAISTTYDKKEYVLVICFECSRVQIYVGGEQKHQLQIDDAAQALLDKVLSGPNTTTNDRGK